MAHVAGTEAAGDLRLDVATGAGGDPAGHVEDRGRAAGADVVRREAGHPLADDLLQRQHVGAGDVVDVHEVARLAAVLEDLRRFTALEGGAEHRGHAGVGGVARHHRAVDVVVAQRHRGRTGLAHPRRGVVLLRQLARGIAAARVEPRVLGHQRPVERAGRRTGSGSRSRRPPGRRPSAAAAAGRRARDRRRGPRRRPPSSEASTSRSTSASCIAASRAAVPRSLWEAYAGRSATRTPAPTSAAWWQTDVDAPERGRPTRRSPASRTSSGGRRRGRRSRPWAEASIRSTPDDLVPGVVELRADRRSR